MEKWSQAQLKAHIQFEAGRIDSLRWVLDRALDAEDSEGKQTVKDRIRDVESAKRDAEGYLSKKQEAARKGREELKNLRAGKRTELA